MCHQISRSIRNLQEQNNNRLDSKNLLCRQASDEDETIEIGRQLEIFCLSIIFKTVADYYFYFQK